MRRLTVALVLLLAAGVSASPAGAASCLNSMPIAEVEAAANDSPDGLAAHGLTVSRGTAPERFEVQILGVAKDAIAPGVDMILVRADSPALDQAGGVWAGMSGSPVYAESDGRLIGAVAYGLAIGPSKIAGLTAADDMGRLLDQTAASTPQTLPLSPELQRKVAATGGATSREAAGGLKRLPLPLSVSGLGASRLDGFIDRLGDQQNVIPYTAGTTGPGDPSAIVPGGNFAAATSYGDVTAAGVGTATAVCGDQVLAFGHPMAFDGPSSLSAHSATAITIQDDPTFAPFKVANIGGVVGTIDQDRLSGIRAVLGTGPTPIRLSSRVSQPNGATRDGLTNVNRTDDVPVTSAFHMIANIDRVLDRVGKGRSTVGWTVSGTAGGQQFSLTRNNRFADPEDISLASSAELFGDLDALVNNEFSPVTVSNVTVDANADAFSRYRITGLERFSGNRWIPVGPHDSVSVKPATTLRIRVLLAAYRSGTRLTPAEFRLAVPAKAAGQEGSIDVIGAPSPDDEPTGDEPTTFDALLTSLRDAPRNDELTATLTLADEESDPAPAATARKLVDQVVTGGLSVPVTVKAAKASAAGGPTARPATQR